MVLTEISGALWLVGDQAVTVPADADVSTFMLGEAVRATMGATPLSVEIRGMGVIVHVHVRGDGSVASAPGSTPTPQILRWLRPAGALPVAAGGPLPEREPERLLLFGTHSGAGATTWARLLRGMEQSTVTSETVLVARSTLAGIDAAKPHAAKAAAVLLVADAAGTVPGDVARSIRVLEGAIPVVRAPWVPSLRGTLSVPDGTENSKVVAKVASTLTKNRRIS